jgi:hypothetical protein
MRAWPIALALLTNACSTDEGAHLTLTMPPGMAPASRLQIVLASADPAMIETVDHQRVAPKQRDEESVVYFRQRATAGGLTGPIDNGFELRITADPITHPDASYVPFVLLYGADDALTGIATLRMGDDPMPQPITIVDGEITKYTLAVEAVTPADPAAAIAAGQALPVTCGGVGQAFTSGIVWRPAAGPELRLLLPDLGRDASAEDATQRALDLDCDTVIASSDSDKECDDVRAAYHRGAAEACDIADTNCDGAAFWTQPCNATACSTGPTQSGAALCDETTGTLGACQADPACLCENGSTACRRCILEIEPNAPASSVVPCQPAVGKLATGCDAASCKVVVLGASPGWQVEVSAQPTGSFGDEAQLVGHDVFVRAALEAGQGSAVPGQGGAYIGDMKLAIYDPVRGGRLLWVALQASVDAAAVCTMVNGDGVMACQ